jgi:hypothetical protein
MRQFEFARDVYAEGKQAVAGRVSFEETKTPDSLNPGEDAKEFKYQMVCEGLAIFKDYSFVGYLSSEDTNIFNTIIYIVFKKIFASYTIFLFFE